MANNTKVMKIQCPFERIKRYNATPEASLYKSVIMQMITDASNISNDPKACRLAKKAKAWLFTNSEDFKMICQMAEIEPQIVVTFAKTLIAIHHEKVRKKERAKLQGCTMIRKDIASHHQLMKQNLRDR